VDDKKKMLEDIAIAVKKNLDELNSKPRHCYNKYCNKLMTKEDFGWFDGGETHLCDECWRLFDGQKMRGRFRNSGFSHNKLVSIGAAMDQLGGCGFNIGHPTEETRYTESMFEWIEWQKEKQ